MARFVVTGAHGFIGQHLCRALSSAGHQVGGIGHGLWPEADARRNGVGWWINADISQGSLRLLQRQIGEPDAIFHLAGGSSVGAALANPREDFFRTVATTAELLDWMRLDCPQARLVAFSSAAVYGAGHSGPIPEQSAPNPFSPYGHHKRLMEELCQSYGASYGVRSCLVRLFSVYGPGLRKQLLWDLCTKLSAGTGLVTLGGSGAELRDWVHVQDIVTTLAGLAEHASPAAPLYNLGTGQGTSVADVARLVCARWSALTGAACDIAFSGEVRPGDPFSLIADTSRLAALGHHPEVALDRGLAGYVDWFHRQGGRP